MATTCDLTAKTCTPCEGGIPPLGDAEVKTYLGELPGWEYRDKKIFKSYSFKNFYQTMAFVNAIAWIANQEDHHPDLEVQYSACTVTYWTHAIGGLSENDFICAAKVNALLP